ncbi:glycosyltransferase family 2 protein [Halioglobus maricola]|uniref:Glycosyltransferase family 2 protein n=1 Tax=Halioglobus maricola TaxID=2601894 RepID=A0A5P9NF08_9GAMM|nr:glycosyltransferase family A protein [Halioglobus maricola]QFU74343.1 glycosyltransferase family 2 protein [Halioglobus maricola]
MSGVFIAMPVFRGVDVIEETVRSIVAQTHRDFHLVMSVDGADDPTLPVCRRLAADPRIDVVVQTDRLGWPGNLNWLMQACDREFFCYWQQDDLASTGYLEALLTSLAARPDAAVAYTDVQWFGAEFRRDSTPSIQGAPLSRVMQHIEAIRYEPLRGVMRAIWLPDIQDPIPVTRHESHQEEFVFLTRMARQGSFIRVADAMYFKRLHDTNTFMRWQRLPEWKRRRGWMSMGAGMWQTASQLAEEKLRPHVLAQLIDRLAVARGERGFFYDTPQTDVSIRNFAREFLAVASIDSTALDYDPSEATGLERPVHPAVLEGIADAREALRAIEDLDQLITNHGQSTITGEAISATGLLGYGWSHQEDWGVWTNADEATMHLPKSASRVEIKGSTFPKDRPSRVVVKTGEGPAITIEVRAGENTEFLVDLEPGHTSKISFGLPDATSPAAEGVSDDQRHLGLGIEQVKFFSD